MLTTNRVRTARVGGLPGRCNDSAEQAWTRRKLLVGIAAAACAPGIVGSGRAAPALPPPPNLSPADALLLRDGDRLFEDYQAAFNSRTMLRPQLRALCRTPQAVAIMVRWCRDNALPFALRSGGHCFEGLSQSSSVVIDTRLLDAVAIEARQRTATIGAGVSLGSLYRQAGAHGLALPAGSCLTIGLCGHVLGGGYGYLARSLGLTCDSLLSVDVVDPEGKLVRAAAQENPDLFWACRGGGGGSFGAAVGLRFRLHPIRRVHLFHLAWRRLPPDRAAAVMDNWQAWAPKAPASICATLVVLKDAGGITLHCSGQSIGTEQELRRELKAMPSSPEILEMSYLAAVKVLGGRSGLNYPSAPMKGKSDLVRAPLSREALATLMHAIEARKGVSLVCDPYGGALEALSAEATAFPHRAGVSYCIEYICEWSQERDTAQRLQAIEEVYAAMRPHMPGEAYVNYCDLDLPDWQQAYWGPNLARLKRIKATFDPTNVFRHAQSVPAG
jgi:FAD/FMN-containing dehydrogenase